MIATATATERKPKTNVFKKMAAAAPTKKGDGGKPTIVCEGPLAEAVERCIHHVAEEKSHKTLAEANKEQAIAGVREQFLAICRKRGESLSSVTLVTPKVKATFTSACMYAEISAEREEMLRELFGDDFERYFAPALKVALKKESAADDSVTAAIAEALGEEFVQKHFDVTAALKVTPALHDDLALREEVRTKASELVNMGVIRQNSPSIKLA